ncbi:PTS sugar transporter subunit IIA [Myxococcota bacterium]|nr:PTS sugar transporter subunit IIA [Myxococcota bacterium]MBU1535712.1 PTS sugar transporter subunit IIA [Myxococcota bacterium]
MSDARQENPNIDELLTISEIAQYLKVSERTIQRMIRSGEVPSAKVSGQWRFVRAIIDDWILSKMQSVQKSNLVDVIATETKIHSLIELVPKEHILMDMKAGPVEFILEQLVGVLTAAGTLPSAEPLFSTLRMREEMMSTAVGGGVALPHPRNPEAMGFLKNHVVLGICPKGTDFDSLDGEKTYVFGLLCARNTTAHLRLMAKLSYLFRTTGIVGAFRKATTAEEILEHIKNNHKTLSIEL